MDLSWCPLLAITQNNTNGNAVCDKLHTISFCDGRTKNLWLSLHVAEGCNASNSAQTLYTIYQLPATIFSFLLKQSCCWPFYPIHENVYN